MHRPSGQGRPYGRGGPVFFGRLPRRFRFFGRRRRYGDSFHHHGPRQRLCHLDYWLHSRRALRRRFFVIFDLRFSLRHQIGYIMTVVPPQLYRDIFVNRAGVGLLLGDTQFREQLQNFVSLYFQLSSQLVNANLSHKNSCLRHRRIVRSNYSLRPSFRVSSRPEPSG